MLQTINDKAKGWVAYAIVIFISIPFMLFGIGSYLDNGETVVAATVNGEDIDISAVTNAALQQKQRLTSIYGNTLPPELDDKTIKTQVLDQLVAQELLQQSVAEHGYRASNDEVGDMIRGMPNFQRDGQFDETTYQQLLASSHLNPATFEQQTRDGLTLQHLTRAIADSGFVSKQQATLYQALTEQERSGQTYTLRAADYTSKVVSDAAKVKAFYDANPDRFMSDERVKLDYLLIDQTEMVKSIEVTDEKLRAHFEKNAGDYRKDEQRKVAHILVSVDKYGKEAAEKRAADLHAQIVASEKTFEELATSESDDTLAADSAGDMGFMALQDMQPEFATAAAKLAVGEVSEPVLTGAGYEIIKVTEITPEVQADFADVKSEVEESYRSAEATELFFEKTETLQTLAFENDGSLDPAANSLNDDIKTTAWITRAGGEGVIGQSSQVRTEAFGEEVLKNGINSSLIEISPTVAVVVRLNTHSEAEVKPFEEVEEEAATTYVDDEARKLTLAAGNSLLAELSKSADWTALASVAELKAEDVQPFEKLKRNDRKLAPQITQEIFKTTAAADGKSSFTNTVLPNGDYVAIGLSDVTDGDAEVSKGGLASFNSDVARREQAALLQSMREQAEVVINESSLE
jgi:peptidyl-prolyl cis-trans isomerase D